MTTIISIVVIAAAATFMNAILSTLYYKSTIHKQTLLVHCAIRA